MSASFDLVRFNPVIRLVSMNLRPKRSAAIAAAERWGAAGLGHGLQEWVVKRTDVHRNLGLAEAWGFVMVSVEKWRRD
ncbi:hypothetical protein EV2_006811 [Malus domestica]